MVSRFRFSFDPAPVSGKNTRVTTIKSPVRTFALGRRHTALWLAMYVVLAAAWSVPRFAIASDTASAQQTRDVVLRATGNEPGWYMEVTAGNTILLVTDYGQKRYSFPETETRSDPHAQSNVLQAVNDGHRLEVILERKPCVDTMSGEQLDTRVTVRLDDQEYRGCGKTLN